MDFGRFEQSLRQTWGEDAALARHEIYFICRRRHGWRQIAHAAAALLRDAWLCARLPRRTPPLSATVCAVSLAGASGWDSISPLLPALRAAGQTVSVLVHPRLQGAVAGLLPAAPGRAGWRLAVLALFQPGRSALPGVSPWTIRCCLARRQLWLGSWRRTLTDAGNNTRALILHNDFDLFSAAAAEAAREMPSIRSVCVQHGLPTDEFFPTRADVQLVWGDASRKAYLAHNTPPDALVIGTYRAKPAIRFPQYLPVPRRILLVSQTHTPIFGRSLENDFLRLATELDRDLEQNSFQILLHPEESRLGHPYAAGNIRSRCRYPPHATLIPNDAALKQPALVVGFCSTALVEAAQAGHFVLGMHWEVPLSLGALAVGVPQYRVRSGAEALRLFNRLRENHRFRSEWRHTQTLWLDSVCAPLAPGWLDDCLRHGRDPGDA